MKTKQTCAFAGCSLTVKGSWGYCPQHVNAARKCNAKGCKRMIAAFNKCGLCAEHRRPLQPCEECGKFTSGKHGLCQEHSKRYGVCDNLGCDTWISAYNESGYCNACRDKMHRRSGSEGVARGAKARRPEVGDD